jgi:hypothetical protein
MAAWGPPILDLAALTSGRWTTERREDFARAYRLARLRAGGSCPPLSELLDLLHAAHLLLAVQWLGWAHDPWHVPGEHRTDWLREVARSASALSA